MNDFLAEGAAPSIARTWGAIRSRANLRTVDWNIRSSSLSCVSGPGVTRVSVACINPIVECRGFKWISRHRRSSVANPLVERRTTKAHSSRRPDFADVAKNGDRPFCPLALGVREVLEIRTRVLGDENHATLGTMHDLAQVCDLLGNSIGGRGPGKEGPRSSPQGTWSEHSSTLMSMNSLAAHYRKLGQLKEAEKLFRQSYDGLSRKRGPDDPDTLFVAGNLGMVLKDLGRLKRRKTCSSRPRPGMQLGWHGTPRPASRPEQPSLSPHCNWQSRWCGTTSEGGLAGSKKSPGRGSLADARVAQRAGGLPRASRARWMKPGPYRPKSRESRAERKHVALRQGIHNPNASTLQNELRNFQRTIGLRIHHRIVTELSDLAP